MGNMWSSAAPPSLEMGQPTEYGKIEFVAKNFDQLPNGLAVFKVFDYKGNSWQLQAYKCGCRSGVVQVTVKLDLLNNSSGKEFSARISCQANVSESWRKGVISDWDNFIESNFTLNPDSPMKELKFEVQLELEKWMASYLAIQILGWFKDEQFGDVTIVAADGKKFRCQREFLARRSPVFHQLFNEGSNERLTEVVIDDFNGEIVTQLLLFIYTGECKKEPVDLLYAVAHKYQLAGLKSWCEIELADNLSADTIVKTYQLATKYHSDMLKDMCVDYLHTEKDVAHMCMADLTGESVKIQEGNEGEVVQQ